MGRRDNKHSDSDNGDSVGKARRKKSSSSRARDRHEPRSSSNSDRKKRPRDEDVSRSSDSSTNSSHRSHSDDDDSSSLDNRRHRKKDDKKRKKKDRKKRDKDDKKSKKERKRQIKKEKKKKRKRDDKHHNDDKKKKKRSKRDDSDSSNADDNLARNYALADAVTNLLTAHPTPAMATDTLPLVLLQLGQGKTLHLSQMTDASARQCLGRVLQCLQPFGVEEEGRDDWKWTAPGGGGGRAPDERILLRIVRALMNEIGITMEAVDGTERRQREALDRAALAAEEKQAATEDALEADKIQQSTLDLLSSFSKQKSDNASGDDGSAASSLPGELGGLCQMILDGENIALDGLPDASLREALEQLFQRCGLEKSEMQEDEDSDDEDEEDAEPAMGYGLPETLDVQQAVRDKLRHVINACQQASSSSGNNKPSKRVVKGPMPTPQAYQPPEAVESSSDEEGPAPVGVARAKGSTPTKEELKQIAALRARQLKGAITGQEELMSTEDGVREEWMLVPGKFDFLSSIKSGNPLKGRTFQNQSQSDRDKAADRASQPVDPRIQAEMDAIMDAHQTARGPTLVEQHRMKKEEERQAKAAAAAGGKDEWKWNRDSDLDKGRRVDKNALNMVLGGAQTDLKKKFQGSF